jgi:hypothetical protein
VSRLGDVIRLYAVLDDLRGRLGEARYLRNCSGRDPWPARGVYFFFEPGEKRTRSGTGPRVVRVGTHAITSTSTTTLWDRLSQHRGVASSGGGNHRGSIFRLLVGEAVVRRNRLEAPSWGVAGSRSAAVAVLGMSRDAIKTQEAPIEIAVSRIIGAMPFLWVPTEDAPGPESTRALIERNAIALLSNWQKEPIDEPSAPWLGLHSGRERVRQSGLWNNNHVEQTYDPSFLDVLARAVAHTRPVRESTRRSLTSSRG